MVPVQVAADTLIGAVVVGDEVYNAEADRYETVVEVIGSPVYKVRTSHDQFILLAQEIGDEFTDVATNETYTVTAVTTGIGGHVTSVTLADSSLATTTSDIVLDFSTADPSVGSTSYGSASFPTASADANNVDEYRKGNNGSKGADGALGIPAEKGDDGKNGPDYELNVTSSNGNITTVSDDLPGIYAASVGGNGGKGGDGYAGSSGKKGGEAGDGGDVTLNNYVNITTTGESSHGIMVQSQAGEGGKGGSGYIFSGGGSGGDSAAGGTAIGRNYGNVLTKGDEANGLFVQSRGGNSGKGGNSYGVVGKAGDGSEGGDGGSAKAEQRGIIVTEGESSHGAMAQSLGGDGGNSGKSGGLVAFGNDGGSAGNGGTAEVVASSTSETVTKGANSHGLFSQSVGGGGGSAKSTNGGAYAIGGGGGTAGKGGTAKITASDDAYVETRGIGSYGLFAQSVGGSGGAAAGTGGFWSVGGTGGSGSDGGNVTIQSGATVVTSGADARGVFAQSVGGGGGDVNATGGVVALGGDGGAAGDGGNVSVSLSSASQVWTSGNGADGVVAQSVGGGGGTGSNSAGLVALGGDGDSGGDGGNVTVSNSGFISTEGDRARGLFAQSVGGGGGAGGEGGSLVTIGGDGGVGSDGGKVTIDNSGIIKTAGDFATALQAQSIGGGGGDGGYAGGAFTTIGGSGAGGGDGGQVDVTHSGVIWTEGNDSHGVFAESIGGGGGNGGSVDSGSLFAGVAIGGSGDGGGDGGAVSVSFDARTVDIDGTDTDIEPLVVTEGDRSRGVFLQSVGGGGGNGGYATNVTAGLFGAVSVAIGGSGGGGGKGGTVSIDGDVNVVTYGDNSEGIYAQSVGGGGGSGGYSIATSVAGGIAVGASVSVGIGGSGGSGGNGGTVDIDSGGSIVTTGDFSTGLLGQSVGGGGGKGGYNISIAVALSDTFALGVPIGIGGSGGDGGRGGTVDVAFDGTISTAGDDAAGALIQSVGGGGGAGGYNVSGAVAMSGVVGGGVAVGLGGSGGGGGNGGKVDGDIGGNIYTSGDRSSGAVIQSVGGGGGSGGVNVAGTVSVGGTVGAGVSVGLGGTGGGGGNGGNVSGSVGGVILTEGEQSDGLVVQSLGGGGGSGGFNVSGNLSISGTGGGSVSVGLGGAGGDGGSAGTVDADAEDDIETQGDQSRGFVAQSLGGGGGAGAFNISGDVAMAGTGAGAVGVGVGGSGGGGGNASSVTADAASISTYGDESAAFTAQSLGGGGGAGAFNITGGATFAGTGSGYVGIGVGGSGGGGGNAGTVDATIDGDIYTEGASSYGALAQSVGGGGGSGAFNVTGGLTATGTYSGSASVGVGGSGGDGGDGDDVTLDLTGSAVTKGDDSDAITAQSLGGGGGNGAFNISGGVNFAATGAAGVSVGIGGSGGGGGDGGDVTLTVNDGVTVTDTSRVAASTEGDRSRGVVVQSLGGGGGSGGFNISGGIAGAGTAAGAINVGIGGSGGDGGDGGAVSADITGYSLTKGEESVAVLAQSVGGGGGAGGFNISGGIAGGSSGAGTLNVGLGGSGGEGGDAGAVTLSINDELTSPTTSLVAAQTEGDKSDAIVAQSLGGGGGSGGFNISGGISAFGNVSGNLNVGIGGSGGGGGDASTVTADIIGAAVTKGEKSTGVLVQSAGGGGGAGGFNINGGIAAGSDWGGNVSLGLGGAGGSGGDGANVSLTMNEDVTDSDDTLVSAVTEGDESIGIIVQSLGGGGGVGGMVIDGNVAMGSSGAGNLGIGIGGKGGGGGDAGTATADIYGDIGTTGDDSSALLVQSVGGGGGKGGIAITAGIAGSKDLAGNILVGIGGAGGDGGDGSTVTATLVGDIETEGEDSSGATFQSIGGGGGSGGFNIVGGISLALGESGAGNLGVGVGGFGGAGGKGAGVTGSLTGDITTEGDGGYGALMQSVGGGGGAGGFNVTGGIAASRATTGSLGFGLGGFGGGGGNAGNVSGTLDGDVSTGGDDAFGVILQSIGGAGGTGGFNVTGNVSLTSSKENTAISAGIGIGGFGGSAGDAGKVTGDVTGLYVTTGENADAVMAQSIAGGGGAGGINISGSVALGSGTAGTVTVGIGGFGGDGGNAGEVKLTREGDTYTTGALSDGLVAQSIGGSGGAGGLNVTGDLSGSTSGNAGSFGFGLGGFGGGGGDADDVTVTVSGSVLASGFGDEETFTDRSFNVDGETLKLDDYRTRSDGSNGVLAQSIGGGGGAGGFNVSGQVAITTTKTSNGRLGSIGIGGFGGDGGNAGEVSVTLAAEDDDTERAQVQAAGDNTVALAAQSIGGGGGVGGFNISGGISTEGQVVVGVGGFGGDGGSADDVTVDVDADIFASGNHSKGLLAQSIGGGGGAGGINISGGVIASLTTTTEPALTFGVGGFAGDGDDAGEVTVTHTGQIMVDGFDVHGVLVQSIGGGGGAGGMNVTGVISGSGGTSRIDGFTFGMGLGGYGGTGADGAEVSLVSNGNIFMNTVIDVSTDDDTGEETITFSADEYGANGAGIVIQSIGGGGGTGGLNATGVIAPSGSPLAMGIGGTGGAGGDSDDVTLVRGYTVVDTVETETPGLIMTFGDASAGIIAQSISGGGGNAGINAVLGVAAASDPSDAISASIAVGGSGGDAGDSGDVSVRHNGDIQTDGDGSGGILAQSITRGGGSGTFNVGTGFYGKSAALSMAIGGDGGTGGIAGDVSVEHDGVIITGGHNSAAITAQSIGRGGGDASFDFANSPFSWNEVSIGLGGKGGTGGEAGDVEVTTDGTLETDGDDSSGIVAQSIGGAGGRSGSRSIGVAVTFGEGANAEGYSGSLAVGRTGGEGGIAGSITVDNAADIETAGERSRGILAQSIGGDGGAGGSAMGLVINVKGAFALSVGGEGGSGAVADEVTVTNDGAIITEGDDSDGILAQSIGGGGGAGGMAGTLGWTLVAGPQSNSSNSLTIAVGGTGGTGGTGDDVSVTNNGAIATSGDKSYGIRAQSIGGGGGVGGAALHARLIGNYDTNSVDVNVGGGGGEGETAGDVDVTNEGLIYTTGTDAAGISANSIGGGGGDAGIVLDAIAGGTVSTTQHRLVVNIGGDGGKGGTGGEVSVINRVSDTASDGDMSGVIVTEGKGAYGIFAQSIGGGGGNSSSIFSMSGLGGGAESLTAGFNFGAFGGEGNKGGKVTVENSGHVQTSGEGAHGIFAQSLGGGGGNGGMVIAGNFIIGSGATNTPLIALGGVGGDGGDGGGVTVTNSGTILTQGDKAHGILAQSIGGGGGNASMGFAATVEPITLVASNAFSAILGATGGGEGGQGGNVTVTHTGDITVLGDGSEAIKAQSINGGGGGLDLNIDGFTALPGLSLLSGTGPAEAPDPLVAARAGAEGASGMNAGKVTVNSTGTIGTGGDDSVAISVDSIGGGGGTISLNFTLAELDESLGEEETDLTVQADLGSDGGENNDGGDIDSTQSGNVVTLGENSVGTNVQSIGGGGGRLFVAIESLFEEWFGGTVVNLGGDEVETSTGGDITYEQDGMVATGGDFSPGAVVQSIGGGGGYAFIDLQIGSQDDTDAAEPQNDVLSAASFAAFTTPTLGSGTTWISLGAEGGTGNDGGAIDIGYSGGFQTTGDHAPALLVQSIGAGGGAATVSGDDAPHIYLGGFKGAEGNGGSVTLANDGQVLTSGTSSHGIIVQSIGGGGGAIFGSFSQPDVVLLDNNSGDGGAVSVTQTGNVGILGDGGIGILAQSIGGGGGFIDGTFLGAAGGAGSGGAVSVELDGSILLGGSANTGVYAQSAGADGTGAVSVGVSGSIEAQGDESKGLVAESVTSAGAGAVDVEVGGSVAMLGTQSVGVTARSEGKTSGAVTVGLTGTVYTSGTDSVGVWAISDGTDSAGNITVTAGDDIRGGAGDGKAVVLEGGADNKLLASGSLSAVSGLVVLAGDGNDTVDNSGAIVGNLVLGAGDNAVLNRMGASFVTIDTLDLRDGAGSTGNFTNAGYLYLGQSAPFYPLDFAAGEAYDDYVSDDPANDILFGTSVISHVALDGDFVQTVDGKSYYDIAFGPYASDRIDATGDAVVEGEAVITLTWLENSDPVPLVATEGTGTDLGLHVEDTIALDYKVIDGDDGILLGYESEFGQDFLTRNEAAMGRHLDSALDVGGANGIGRLLALLGSLPVGQEDLYAEIFSELDPEAYLAPSVEQFQSARDFAGNLFGCADWSDAGSGPCLWNKIEVHGLDRDGSDFGKSVEIADVFRLRFGADVPMEQGWSLGWAMGYDNVSDIAFDGDRAMGQAYGYHGGFGFRRTFGDAGDGSISFSVIAGKQYATMHRRQAVFTAGIGSAEYGNTYVGFVGEAGYSFDLGPVFVRPGVGASYLRVGQGAFTETGLDGLGVAGDAHGQWIASIVPQITVGAEITDNARLILAGGAVIHDTDAITHPFRLLGADSAADPAMIATPIDEKTLFGEARLQVFGGERLQVDMGYRGEFGGDTNSHQAHIAARLAF
ncbi:autotransporter outer membrane beta-barrel domain-containing protein [Oricola sp.]|uniref:autotransporter outer membrane beta-barrel domain-containing protein n=1 Tax=Oricola sp. TaxID=1979950 RepID=UPI0025D275E6|nr:autotransporter outer membrane beta-barrel domain-containing protein [Oricola sp.]MCI5076916.1 autotransporter outer membrane beta-barrel domain-containing protein [Oricola sp.]